MIDTTTKLNDHTVRYLDSNSNKQPVILLHGLGGCSDKWKSVIDILSASYRVIAPDIIGYGQSDKPVVNYTPTYMVSFVKKFITAIDIENPHIVGASLGGQVAVQFAARYKQYMSKLVLVSPAGIMKRSTPALDQYIMAALYPRESSVSHALQLMEGSERPPSKTLIQLFMTNMKRPNAKMAFMSSLLCFKNSNTIHRHLKKVTTPTLLVWGDDDPIIPVSYAGKFTSVLPNCTFTTIPNCGHTPYVQYPEHFCKILSDFFATQKH